MRSHSLARAVSLIAVCAFVAACGESTAPKPSVVTVDSLFADIANGLDVAAPALDMVGGIFVPLAVMPSAASCPYTASTQRFVCPTATSDGLTFAMFYQLLDGAGAAQSAFSPSATSALRTVFDMSGTTTLGETPGTMTLTAHSDQTLSGLLATNYTLNGTLTDNISLAAPGLPATTLNMTQTITNLVLPKHGAAEAYPKGGTIAMTMTSSDGLDAHITVTFDGSSVAKIVMTTNGFTTHCTMDMKAAEQAPVCSL